jgi:hypothetical protein
MFRILSRKIVEVIIEYKETEPSLNFIISQINLPTAYVNVTSNERFSGKTYYSFFKLVNLSIGIILSFSTKPLRLVSKLGIIMSLASFIVVVYTIVHSLISDTAPVGWPTLIAAIFMLSGIQIFVLGIIGEYIGKIFIQSKQRPRYTVEEKIGFE